MDSNSIIVNFKKQIVWRFENVKEFRKPKVNVMSNCDKDVLFARLSGWTVIRTSDLGNALCFGLRGEGHIF